MTDLNHSNKSKATGSEKWHAIIVDDNQIDAFVCKRLLETSEIISSAKWISNTDDALGYLRNDRNQSPNIIFVDLQIPIKDGFYFLQEYSKNFKNDEESPAIVVLTSYINKQITDKIKNYKTVFKIIEKPLNLAVIKELQQEILNSALTVV